MTKIHVNYVFLSHHEPAFSLPLKYDIFELLVYNYAKNKPKIVQREISFEQHQGFPKMLSSYGGFGF